MIRIVKNGKYVGQDGKTSLYRQFLIKDFFGTRSRATFWNNNIPMDKLRVGGVFHVGNLKTSKFPDTGPPFYLTSTVRTTVKEASQSITDVFKSITESDGEVSGIICGFNDVSQHRSCKECRSKISEDEENCHTCEAVIEEPEMNFKFMLEITVEEDQKTYLGFKSSLADLIDYEEFLGDEDRENDELEQLLNEKLEGKEVFLSFKLNERFHDENDEDVPIALELKPKD